MLVLLAVLLGGGGAEGAIRNGLLEALGALLLAACTAAHFTTRPLPRETLGPLLFAAAVLLFLLLQLVPLPPSLWTSLPGRETASAAARLTGPLDWRPLSLDPEATRRTALGLLLPLAILFACLQSGHRGLMLVVRAAVAAALASALFGAIQVALGTPPRLAPFGSPEAGVASGFFANRNHQAQLMVLGIIASALLIRVERPQIKIRALRGKYQIHLGWLLIPLFVLMTVASASVAGMALLAPALLAAGLIALRRPGTTRLAAILLGLLAVGLVLFALPPNALHRVMTLQAALVSEGRIISWSDLLFTLRQYWPWGSGLGTFAPVFRANENLDLVGPLTLNHAHNEIVELMIEGGIAATLLLAAALAAIVARLWRLVSKPRSTDAGPALAGLTMLALLFLQSLVDYPLRTHAIAAFAALAVALYVTPAQRASAPARNSATSRRGRRRSSGFAPPTQAAGPRAW